MKRILIIEDQSDIRELIRLTLEMDDRIEIHEASSGAAGLDAAYRLGPALVLLDVMMPGELDGFQVCERLRADARTRRAKVVMLSARTAAEDMQRARQAGADDYLTKPFSPRQLLSVVGRLL